ncbi:MAG: O-antigen ligase family protein [Pirellulales bacterium]
MVSSALTVDTATTIPRRWIICGYLALLGAVFLLALKKPVVLLAIPLLVPALWIALAAPSFYTLLAMGLIYSNAAVIAVRFHGVPMIVGMAVPLLLAIPIAHAWLFRRRPIMIDPVFQLGVLFVLTHLFATLFSADREESLSVAWEMATEGLVLYLLIFNAVRTTTVLRRVAWVVLACGAALGGLCFLQNATRTYDRSYGGFAQVEARSGFFTKEAAQQGYGEQRRLAGPIGEKNRFAQIMLMLVPLGMFRFWAERNIWLRALAAFATALVMLGLMLTFSRGAMVGFCIMVLAMMVLRYVTARQCLAVLGGICLLLIVLPQYITRLESLGALLSPEASIGAADNNSRSRIAEAMSAVYMFADHPWTGVGPGMYQHHFQRYAGIVGTEIQGVKVQDERRQPHVLYLGLAAELGLPGTAAFLAMMAVLLVRLNRVRQASLTGRSDLALLAAGFLFAIISYLGSGLFLHLEYVRYFWLMTALAGAASAIVAQELSTPDNDLKGDPLSAHQDNC